MYLPPVARLLRLNAELLEAVVEYEAQVPVPVEPKQEESTESVGMDIDGDEITAPDSTETSGPQSKLKKRGIAGGKGSLEEDDERIRIVILITF